MRSAHYMLLRRSYIAGRSALCSAALGRLGPGRQNCIFGSTDPDKLDKVCGAKAWIGSTFTRYATLSPTRIMDDDETATETRLGVGEIVPRMKAGAVLQNLGVSRVIGGGEQLQFTFQSVRKKSKNGIYQTFRAFVPICDNIIVDIRTAGKAHSALVKIEFWSDTGMRTTFANWLEQVRKSKLQGIIESKGLKYFAGSLLSQGHKSGRGRGRGRGRGKKVYTPRIAPIEKPPGYVHRKYTFDETEVKKRRRNQPEPPKLVCPSFGLSVDLFSTVCEKDPRFVADQKVDLSPQAFGSLYHVIPERPKILDFSAMSSDEDWGGDVEDADTVESPKHSDVFSYENWDDDEEASTMRIAASVDGQSGGAVLDDDQAENEYRDALLSEDADGQDREELSTEDGLDWDEGEDLWGDTEATDVRDGESDNETDSDSDSDSDSETENDSVSDKDSDSETDTDNASDNDSDDDNVSDKDSDSETDTDTASDNESDDDHGDENEDEEDEEDEEEADKRN